MGVLPAERGFCSSSRGFLRSASATGDFAVDGGEMKTPRTRGKGTCRAGPFAFGRRIRVQRERSFGSGREGERQWTKPVSSLRYGIRWSRGSRESPDRRMRRSLAITRIEFRFDRGFNRLRPDELDSKR